MPRIMYIVTTVATILSTATAAARAAVPAEGSANNKLQCALAMPRMRTGGGASDELLTLKCRCTVSSDTHTQTIHTSSFSDNIYVLPCCVAWQLLQLMLMNVRI